MKLPIPKCIYDYNQHMGGVDVADQLRSYYTNLHRSYRTWWPLFVYTLELAVCNCYLIARAHNRHSGSQCDFRINLVNQLV